MPLPTRVLHIPSSTPEATLSPTAYSPAILKVATLSCGYEFRWRKALRSIPQYFTCYRDPTKVWISYISNTLESCSFRSQLQPVPSQVLVDIMHWVLSHQSVFLFWWSQYHPPPDPGTLNSSREVEAIYATMNTFSLDLPRFEVKWYRSRDPTLNRNLH